ncbi:ABC transporter substrate-binding protein [Diaminobutyricimonas sp. TR449]|uniref:ABC transporter substrate-binding protein n=1 Tax=Diaminobutyricimonas sp. TR449 TaxID=2708076 RepID=UPI001421223A|nr:ABC transporter substrate-binding protein [Diaminobutyricimonas sp. TR449]
MRNRTLSLLAGGAITALVLTGCAAGTGSNNEDDTDYDPDATLSGELDIMGFGAGDEIGLTRFDLAAEALGEDVELNLIEGDLDMQQFLSSVAAGDPPALVYANRDQIGSLAARGAIISLDRCIEGENIDTDQYLESALDQVTFDGSVYGIPEFNTVQLTMANQSLLDAAGLTIADVNGSNWQAITAANQALMQPGSVIGVDTKLPEFLPLWAKANGADLISEDGKTAQLNDPAVVEALEFAVSVYDAQGGFSSVKAFRDSADFFGEGNQYATNTLGSMWMEQWYINVLNDVSADAPMAFDTYRTPQGEPLAYAAGSAWAIPAGTDTAAAACRYAKVMTEVDSWIAAAQARLDLRTEEGKPFTGVLTGNEVADEQIREMVTSGGEPWDSGVAAMYEANDNTFSLPANPADAEFKSAWQDAVNRVLNGQDDPQTALDTAQEEAQKALDEAWESMENREG